MSSGPFGHTSSVCYDLQVANAPVAHATFPRMNEVELNEFRIARLSAAVDHISQGNKTDFGRRLGYKDGAFVRQMISGIRPVTEKTIWSIESMPGMKGWFDADGATGTPPPPSPAPWPFPEIPEQEVRALPPAQLNALQGALGLAIAQLRLGIDVAAQSKNDRLQRAKAAILNVAASANDEQYVPIRKVAVKVRAGVPGFSADQTAEEFDGVISLPQKWLDERKLNADQLIATSVFGDSMEPRITKDDLLLVNTADTTRKAGKLFGANHEGEFVVKRLERRDGHWHLVSDNPDQVKHPPVRCNEKTFVIGRIVMLQAENV